MQGLGAAHEAVVSCGASKLLHEAEKTASKLKDLVDTTTNWTPEGLSGRLACFRELVRELRAQALPMQIALDQLRAVQRDQHEADSSSKELLLVRRVFHHVDGYGMPHTLYPYLSKVFSVTDRTRKLPKLAEGPLFSDEFNQSSWRSVLCFGSGGTRAGKLSALARPWTAFMTEAREDIVKTLNSRKAKNRVAYIRIKSNESIFKEVADADWTGAAGLFPGQINGPPAFQGTSSFMSPLLVGLAPFGWMCSNHFPGLGGLWIQVTGSCLLLCWPMQATVSNGGSVGRYQEFLREMPPSQARSFMDSTASHHVLAASSVTWIPYAHHVTMLSTTERGVSFGTFLPFFSEDLVASLPLGDQKVVVAALHGALEDSRDSPIFEGILDSLTEWVQSLSTNAT